MALVAANVCDEFSREQPSEKEKRETSVLTIDSTTPLYGNGARR